MWASSRACLISRPSPAWRYRTALRVVPFSHTHTYTNTHTHTHTYTTAPSQQQQQQQLLTQRWWSTSAPVNHTNQLPSLDAGDYAKFDARRRKLLYRSKERGMLETDLLMGTFALKHLLRMTDAQLDEFEFLLDVPDPDLFAWITRKGDVPPEHNTPLMAEIQQHAQSNPLHYESTIIPPKKQK
eukprot:TRINITY_DN2577_c1_g1_i1.p1 TRINITY_DN2577_c1_g1~~TRINITY_DN2577_c1_g1_i1.p1  ORF type:complete len:184 (+),score=37.54 TRINITY_DN2577_c1_g1_i1:32-583(+)